MLACHWLRSCKSSLNRPMYWMPTRDTPHSCSTSSTNRRRRKTMKAIDINKEEKAMNSYRKIASIAGILLLIGAVTALVSNGLTDPMLRAPDYLTSISAHGTQIMIGALIAVIEAITSASIAIALYPVL